MKNNFKYLFLFILILFSTLAKAQSGQIVVDRVPFVDCEKRGIHKLLQDTTGLIWLFGSDKWYISDGEKITETPIPTFSNNKSFVSGVTDSTFDENFYLGGDSLRIFNPSSRKIVKAIGLDEDFDTKGQTPYLYYIVAASDSIIWALYSPAKGPIRYDREKGSEYIVVQSRNGLPFQKIGEVSEKDNSSVKDLTVRGDQLFIRISNSIFQYNLSGELVKTHTFPVLSSTLPILTNRFVDKDDNVNYFYFSRDSNSREVNRALFYLEPNSSNFKNIAYPELNGLGLVRVDNTGADYWALGSRMSLLNFSLKKEGVKDYTKYILQQHPDLLYFTDQILNVIQDKTQTFWVSSMTNGVFKISNTEEPFKHYLSDKRAYSFCAYSSCIIRGITVDDQGIIYFAYDYGIKKLDPKTDELKELEFNHSGDLNTAYNLSFYNGKLYLNALEIDPKSGSSRPIIPFIRDNNITHYIDKTKGQMWIADSGHKQKSEDPITLYHYDLQTRALKTIGHYNSNSGNLNQASQIYLSPTTNTLFMATIADGLYELNFDGSIIQHLFEGEVFGTIRRALSLYEDPNQQLWIGHAKGLSRLDLKTKEFIKTPYHSVDPFSNRQVYSIQAQNETYAWLGTGKGLYRLNIKTGELQNFKMFPLQSEMEFNRLSTFQRSDGTFYFGSVEGLYEFHPDSLVKESRLEEDYRIQLARVAQYDTNKDSIIYTFHDLVTTSTFHNYSYHRSISFDVFVPDYRDAEKNTYTWWLENYENRWSKPNTINTIRYDNLPPGTYTLHVQGGITKDYFKNSERKFQITVHPHWYDTWWARSLRLLFLIGLVYLIYRYNIKRQLEKTEAKRLKELDNLKSRLYTNITHEFRTPLTVIMGMTNNIKGYAKEKNLIYRNSKNLLRLINQLLDLSKLDSGSLKMDKIQGDIVTYLQYLTESFYSMAEEKQIRLTFYPEVKELIMDYDETKIQHIIYNLLTNAIKFTPEGGKVILHLKDLNKNNQEWLQIKVSDTGIGISEESLPKIFDRFYQGDASSTRREAGTGIGLALTKELIKMMKGEISVQSRLGKGTDFKILLPVVRNPDTNKQSTETFLNDEYVPESNGEVLTASLDLQKLEKNSETPTLLIIEDNRDVVTYIESLLKNDYWIEVARDGQEGIDKALEMIPDIIISDVMMPKKDGYQVCQALKSNERSSHIPIILLTAKATVEDRIEGLKEGADAYLTKPFQKEELFVHLDKLVKLRKSLQEKYASNAYLLTQKPSRKEPSLDDLFLQKLIKVIHDRLDDPDLAVVHLCRAVHLSNTQVNRKLKSLTGKTPSSFIRTIRLQKALEMLKSTDLNVSEIAYDVGFKDPNYFSRSFSEEFGHPPNAIRK